VTLVAVPEASVYQDDGTVAREHNVGLSGQTAGVKSVTEAAPVQSMPDRNFGASVGTPNAGHHPAPYTGIDDVSH
jgi:hypothetical protein